MKQPFRNPVAYWAAVAGGVCLAAVIAYHVVCGENGYLAYRHARQQYDALVKQNNQVRQENEKLRQHIDALNKRDPAAIEKQAREQLHMAKPGEIVFTLPAAPAGSQAPNSKDTKSPSH